MPGFETTVEVEFEVHCGRCGTDLSDQSAGVTSRRGGLYGGLYVQVDPCHNCMQEYATEERTAAYEEGYSARG